MKYVLFSIKPQYVVDIINGDKTNELRKTIPRDSIPFIGYVYCTKGKEYACVDQNGVAYLISKDRYDVISRLNLSILNGTVCVAFTCNGFDVLKCGKVTSDHDEMLALSACVPPERIEKYGNGSDVYALNLEHVELFKKSYSLSSICTYQLCDGVIKYSKITRAPQSWQYVCKISEAA